MLKKVSENKELLVELMKQELTGPVHSDKLISLTGRVYVYGLAVVAEDNGPFSLSREERLQEVMENIFTQWRFFDSTGFLKMMSDNDITASRFSKHFQAVSKGHELLATSLVSDVTCDETFDKATQAFNGAGLWTDVMLYRLSWEVEAPINSLEFLGASAYDALMTHMGGV